MYRSPKELAEQNPVGATRYHGQGSRGSQHCRCVVTGHTARGAVKLRRESNGALFSVVGGLYHSYDELVAAESRFLLRGVRSQKP